jgi:hypothetical protein
MRQPLKIVLRSASAINHLLTLPHDDPRTLNAHPIAKRLVMAIAAAILSYDVSKSPALVAGGVIYYVPKPNPITPVIVERDWSWGRELPDRLS